MKIKRLQDFYGYMTALTGILMKNLCINYVFSVVTSLKSKPLDRF